MANENIIESGAGESGSQNKPAHGEKTTRRAAEELKSAMPAAAKEFLENPSKAWDEAKERVGGLRDSGEHYVRKNPMKAVFTALGVGFMLGFILRH
jgi:ElaB/YqjD/DUF883 family membrane-anchored ribosome-binding protein